MAINRTLNFYTQMGPGDVVLAGYFENNPGGDVGLEYRVTPRTCAIAEVEDPPGGDKRYRLTFPGTGSLRLAGLCMACSPSLADVGADDVIWPKWHYNDSERAVYIELRNQGGASLSLPADYRVYFTAHIYPSSAQRPNITVEL